MDVAILDIENTSVRQDTFYYDVLSGLRSNPKKLPPKYFYDKKGSEYFDQICHLEEYYPYKTELELLPEVAKSLRTILREEYALVEFGAGSLLKVKPLLNEIHGIKQFLPIDISGEHLRSACQLLAAEYEQLTISPLEADFSQPIDLKFIKSLHPLGFFPGSTIGNFTPPEAKTFLRNVRTTLGPGGHLLIGVDTKKSPEKIHRAYNDEHGVTAKFNLNILERINHAFGNVFQKEKFEHYAYYNATKGCVEMHLVCLQAHNIILDGIEISFDQGESIHTENSYKYSIQDFSNLAESAGWNICHYWLAKNNMFSIYLLRNDN